MTLRTDYADATTSATNHAAAHNDVNTQVNTNVASLAAIDARYRHVLRGTTRATSTQVTGAAVYAGILGGAFTGQAGVSLPWLEYLDPANFDVAGKTTYLRVVCGIVVNDTAPAATLTLGLYPVGTPSGGAAVLNPNFGTVVTGTTIAFTTPGANTKPAPSVTSDIAFPAAGWYGIGLSASGAMTANSAVVFDLRLEARNV